MDVHNELIATLLKGDGASQILINRDQQILVTTPVNKSMDVLTENVRWLL